MPTKRKVKIKTRKIKSKGIPEEKANIDPNNSKYGPALILACLEPDSWDLTLKELADKIKDVMKKQFRVKDARSPAISTIQQLMNHPNFQKELRANRKLMIIKALPAIEKAMIEKVIEEGDVHAYDRMLRASGESLEDIQAGNFDHISDEELDEMINHFAKEKE